MSDQTSIPAAEAQPSPPTPAAKVRPFYWSVRRELWENRSIFAAPLAVAGVILFGGLVGVMVGPHSKATVHATTTVVQNGSAVTHTTQLAAAMTPGQRAALAVIPYDFVALALIVTLFIVAVFFSLGALHNERRDRSVLFWKSLPVSDLTTVLSKAIVPLAVLPPVAFVITLATQLVMLLMNTASLAAHGKSVADLWAQAPLVSMPLLVLYALVTLTLWWAPVYAWLMLISGWAKRAPFLWAVLPPLFLALAEKIALGTENVWSLILYRVLGGFQQAFVVPTRDALKAGTAFPNGLPQLDPGKLVATPALWVGLAVAAALFAACVWLRRRSDPI
jgi:ABC-2 type transport system permease protein